MRCSYCSQTPAERSSKLRAQAGADHRHRAAVAVIGRVHDELVVEGQPPREQRKTVIHLDDLLGAGIGELSIADENAEAARIEESLVRIRNAIDDARKADAVVRPYP